MQVIFGDTGQEFSIESVGKDCTVGGLLDIALNNVSLPYDRDKVAVLSGNPPHLKVDENQTTGSCSVFYVYFANRKEELNCNIKDGVSGMLRQGKSMRVAIENMLHHYSQSQRAVNDVRERWSKLHDDWVSLSKRIPDDILKIKSLDVPLSVGGGSLSSYVKRDSLENWMKQGEDLDIQVGKMLLLVEKSETELTKLVGECSTHQDIIVGLEASDSCQLERVHWAHRDTLARVAKAQASMAQLGKDLSMMRKRMQCLEAVLLELEKISKLPGTYTAALEEVVRRKNFMREYTAEVTALVERVSSLCDAEVGRREAFMEAQGNRLPSGLIPGLTESRVPYCEVTLRKFDQDLPNLDREQVDAILNKI